MDYCKVFFGKSLSDIVLDDIYYFFDEPKEETVTIEFKSFHEKSTFDVNIDAIIKGLSAFLNSDGGVLIWGAPVGQKVEDRKELIFQGKLSLVTVLKEKDALINIVSSRITPLPNGISVNILSDKNGSVYLFEVQPSKYKPHQFRDTYFIRLDGQSKPAPHYLVQALFRQVTYPSVEVFIKLTRIRNHHLHLVLFFEIFICNFTALQNDESVAYQLIVNPGIIDGDGGHFYSIPEAILFYGRPVRNTHTIEISIEDLERRDYLVKLKCSFGGKKTPSKISEYTLNINQPYPNNEEANLNYMFVEMRENMLFSDLQNEKGSTKESFLKKLLGR